MNLDIESRERKIVRVETALILPTIAAVAVADAWARSARSFPSASCL